MSAEVRDTRLFLKRWGRLFAIAVATVLLVLLLRFEADVFFCILAGILFALALNGTSNWLHKHTRLPYKAAVALLVVAFVAAVLVGATLLGARLLDQAQQLVQRVPEIIESFRTSLSNYPAVQNAVPEAPKMMPSPQAAASGATGAALALGHGLGAVVVIFFVGLYGALSPDAYPKIALRLVPPRRRVRFEQIFTELGQSLKRWLLGRAVAIVTVGVMCCVGLWIIGVPLALGLGVLAGVATFVEYLGAIASAVPAILLALTKSPMAALWTVAVFTGAHIVEGYVITPLITQRQVRLLPAYTLSAQAVFGGLFGVLGITFATPVMVISTILVRSLYIEDMLGDRERHDVRSARGEHANGGESMNWDRIAGNWKMLKGQLRQKFGQLTDSDVDSAGGMKDKIVGALRERYGYAKDKAEQEVDAWAAGVQEGREEKREELREQERVERPSQRDLH